MKRSDLFGTIFRTAHNKTPSGRVFSPPFHLFHMDSCNRYCYDPKLQWNPQVQDYFIKAYGADHFSRISEALTRPSCYSCIRVNTLKSTSDAVINKLISFLQETKFERDMDWESESIAVGNGDSSNVGLERCQLPGLEHVVIVRGSGPHMIDYGDVPNQPPKEVIVSRKCAEAVLRGAQVYVPGVMACSSHVEEGNTVAVSVAVEQPSLDNGWAVGITRGTVLQGSQTDPHYLERRGLYIGQGMARMSRAGIFRASKGIAVEMTNRVFRLPSFYDVLEGEIFLQNLPSIVTACVLDPQQGERILDMCAAPGGKTTAIAILMRDKGEIIAVDRSHNKVMDIQKLAAEMGLTSITSYKLDALKSVCRVGESGGIVHPDCINKTIEIGYDGLDTCSFEMAGVGAANTRQHKSDPLCEDSVSSEKANQTAYQSQADTRKNIRRMRNGPGRNQCMGGRVEKSKGFGPNTFDRVLLDAPCSALGLRPRLCAGEETLDSLRNHGKYQRRMFDQAVQLVRPGGVIVYSTCTINPGENEALVRYALDKYKFLSLAPQHPRIGGPGLVGSCELFGAEHVEEWLRDGEEELVQRFDPSSPLDTIGFFIAKFSVGQKET